MHAHYVLLSAPPTAPSRAPRSHAQASGKDSQRLSCYSTEQLSR